MEDSASPSPPALPSPHSQIWLDDDPSGHYHRTELWAVLLFKLLDGHQAEALISLAEQHAAAHGWSTGRHKYYPTTDIAVGPDTAPALHSAIWPLIDGCVLPLLAKHFSFHMHELSMRDLFVVKYEASRRDVQDHLAPHRDGNLLSFSVLLSDPAEFDGGGLRFHSLGPTCKACSSTPRQHQHLSSCSHCNGTGRLAIPGVGRGDLTLHCGKLLHEGAPVLRGKRYLIVGFVIVTSPRVDLEFVATSQMANTSASGRWADHQVVGQALRQPPRPPKPPPQFGGEDDLAGFF